MWTYVRVKSEYFEYDASRYRLAMMQNTLIPSLQNQTDKRFSLVVSVSPMDPFFSKRLQSFDEVGVSWNFEHEMDLEVPRRQVDILDDVFLGTSVIESVNKLSPELSVIYSSDLGFSFRDYQLMEYRSYFQPVTIAQITEDEDYRNDDWPFAWIQPAHQMNDDPKIHEMSGEEVDFKWPGWSSLVVGRLAKTRIAMASAQGCQLHPARSKSVIFAHKEGRRYGN